MNKCLCLCTLRVPIIDEKVTNEAHKNMKIRYGNLIKSKKA